MDNNIMEATAKYEKESIRLGRLTLVIVLIANFLPCAYLATKGIKIDFGTVMAVWGVAFSSFGLSWIVQPISYYPAMGVAGTYVTWVAGSGSNLRLPASNIAKKAAGVEEGTPQGDVISTIGITCSVFVSAGMVTLFTFIGAGFLDKLPESITAAFNYILPAVFGAIMVDLSGKNLRLGILSLVSSIFLVWFLKKTPIPSAFVMPICIIVSILLARMLFVMDEKKAAQA